MAFKNAVRRQNARRPDTFTQNGLPAFTSSGDNFVDLFYLMGTARGYNISDVFMKAYNENAEKALRALFLCRDREGVGERQTFRNLIAHLNRIHPDVVRSVMPLIPHYGRWDDLFGFFGANNEDLALSLIKTGLSDKNGLLAKWLPRKGEGFHIVRKYLGMTPQDYRHLIVGLSNTVEQKMCAKDWNSIEFQKVPSIAAARLQKAFVRNAREAYTAYRESLKRGETKVNASVVFPHTVIKALRNGDRDVSTAMWDALPNFLDENRRYLPIIDVSGSMEDQIPGTTDCPLDIGLALGIYVATKQKNDFSNVVITFDSDPSILELTGDLSNKVNQLMRQRNHSGTDLHKVMKCLLSFAKENNLSNEDMPEALLIFSDMQFNSDSSGLRFNETAHQMIMREFQETGYNIPRIVYWNLKMNKAMPVQNDKRGVTVLSGFSPALLKQSLASALETPADAFTRMLYDERYNLVSLAYNTRTEGPFPSI